MFCMCVCAVRVCVRSCPRVYRWCIHVSIRGCSGERWSISKHLRREGRQLLIQHPPTHSHPQGRPEPNAGLPPRGHPVPSQAEDGLPLLPPRLPLQCLRVVCDGDIPSCARVALLHYMCPSTRPISHGRKFSQRGHALLPRYGSVP